MFCDWAEVKKTLRHTESYVNFRQNKDALLKESAKKVCLSDYHIRFSPLEQNVVLAECVIGYEVKMKMSAVH